MINEEKGTNVTDQRCRWSYGGYTSNLVIESKDSEGNSKKGNVYEVTHSLRFIPPLSQG